MHFNLDFGFPTLQSGMLFVVTKCVHYPDYFT